ncbi:thylakoid membrane protein TERC, chloroplastic-like isoform X2 [Zingiber officinale]|uniref:thylakoid membrane protein TERC, chloroplastic-like isoform X2 n=1 Tax=Zingiber officinale TaxID=94328 RepID=UPI001C4D12A1|nr:thylakoid membrane protein TERC, chloroplastic-like isoform X2 [Zingiber officinale]
MRIHELAEFLMKMQGESAGSALEVAAQAIIDSVKEVNPLKVFRKKKGLLLDSYRTLLTDGNTVHPPLGVHTVFVASSFGICLGFKDGIEKASEYFAGYILEQSISIESVFVLIFKYFKVPVKCQSRLLSYGIAGAIIFPAIIILLGTATIQRFELVNVLLAWILLFFIIQGITGRIYRM